MPGSNKDEHVTSRERTGLMPKRRRWVRRGVVVLCVLVVGLVALVALAPTLISTHAGKRYVMGTISEKLAGEIDADSLHVTWSGGQSLTNAVVRDADGREVARVGRVDLPDVSLLELVRGGMNLGALNVEQVSGQIIGYDDGTTNLQRTLASTSRATGSSQTTRQTPAAQSRWPAGLSFVFTLRDFDVTYRPADASEPIRLVIPEAKLTANDPTHLLMKFGAEFTQAQQSGSIRADAQVDQLFDTNGHYQLASATAHIDGQMTDLPIEMIDTLMQDNGRLLTLLGLVLNGRVLADVTTAGGSATVNADSETLHVNANVAFDDAGLKQSAESSIRYTLDPKAWTELTTTDGPSASTLQQPVEIVIALNKLNLPFSDQGVDLSKLNVDLGMTVGEMNLAIDGVGDVSLTSTTGTIQTQQLAKSLTTRFNTTSSLNNKPGDVTLNVQLNDLMDEQGRFDPARVSTVVNGQLTNAPVAAILDELIPGVTKGLATRSLGKAMDATLSLNTHPDADGQAMTGNFELDVLTDQSETDLSATLIGSFDYSKQAIHTKLSNGSYSHLTLTQSLLDAFTDAFKTEDQQSGHAQERQLTLGAPAKLRLDISRFAAELNATPDGAYQLDPQSLIASTQITSSDVVVLQDGKPAATLTKPLVNVVNDTGMAGDTHLTLHAGIDYPTQPDEDAKPGSITSDTTFSGMTELDGRLYWAKATIKTDTVIRQAPVDLIDQLFGMDGDLIASVGPRALLTLNGEYTPAVEHAAGGLDLVLKSRYASADMKLLVEKDKWTLKNDAPLAFRVTPRLSRVLLKRVNPFLGSAVSAKLPINVTIKRDGFSAPLHDITLSNINAGITLNLGELDLRGEGELKQILKALNIDNRSLATVGFTPVSISLANGKLSYTNLVMGIDEVKLGFSGSVDLSSKALDMKMTIPGSSLSQIKWLKGPFGDDEAIVVPLTGTYDKPTLDIKLLTGAIAKKVVQSELKGAAGGAIRDQLGDDAGAVVGGLLNDLLTGDKTTDDQAEAQPSDETQPQPDDDQADKPLTDQERAARKERRRLRRERLEREQAEREAQQQ